MINHCLPNSHRAGTRFGYRCLHIILFAAFLLCSGCGLGADSRLQKNVLNNELPDPADNNAVDNNASANNASVNNATPSNNHAENNNNPVDNNNSPVDPGAIVAGHQCDCDSDCVGTETNPGICVQGICMQQATTTCSAAGSTEECPEGFRCWDSICFPNCADVDCEGRCDSDDSCTFSANTSCKASCSEICTESENNDDFQGDCGENMYYEQEACFCNDGFVIDPDPDAYRCIPE